MEGVVVRAAEPRDAFSVGALHIQHERELASTIPAGFLDAFADAWLRDRARRTWLAEEASGRPVGVVHGTRVQKLPSAHRGAEAWFHVSLLFVARDARGRGTGEQLMRALLRWARGEGVTRIQLHAVPQARSLYERLGFGPASDRFMEYRLDPDP
ncbi:GNAT family N-acetyltransferase [Phycicoccus endophyticus]|uniref:GNAT family N-acetyltransferase n=1 Tax=Phycicoccus endophyticus TaxID=1690220 RepID=A0A7G9R4Q7_9MICO|nr:GNAT family N-acetyltransferase [Phycicoccus endophyticus]NHI18494.1 GNAT family N-acetyltransferase [Phycicoccus endophyticus]QNN50582.1 GNAT family N-acetyltransferase [Phycicoccus endophyticus]GGL23358.1 N-acetyltransferase [Phycicoccus endophyticus]